ncbi:MAG: PfkB family carbohydrate kinase [Propionibacteriaceae bacterium]|nr:PfkB family carbohydrate kinase [Propionibacteriaceae bacterium]
MGVVAFGLLTVDHRLTVDAVPKPNQKVVALGSDFDFGGPAANGAATARVLGMPTRFITAVGSGLLASFALDGLRGLGVEVVDLLADEPGEPSVSTVMVTRSTGDRTVVSHNALSVRDNLTLTGHELDDATVLLVDGHHMATAIRLCQMARRRGVTVLFDGGSWKDGTDELLKYVDVAAVSADFVPPGAGDALDYVAASGCRQAVQTRGAASIRVLDNGHSSEVAVPPVEVVDTLGAGDVFHGALAYFMARDGDQGDPNETFSEHVRQAAEVASLSCRYEGAHGIQRYASR